MNNIPNELKYTTSHEWIRIEIDGSVTVGITDYAQALLGDIVLIQLPALKSMVSAGQACGLVESVKAASDIYAPVSGLVVAVNKEVEQLPKRVNSNPYTEGWLLRLQPTHLSEMEDLLSATAYAACVDE